MAAGQGSLQLLKEAWRKLLFPDASDEQFADGYAQAVTFGLLMARAFDIPLGGDLRVTAITLGDSNTLIGAALAVLTQDKANQETLKTSLKTLTRVARSRTAPASRRAAGLPVWLGWSRRFPTLLAQAYGLKASADSSVGREIGISIAEADRLSSLPPRFVGAIARLRAGE